MTEARLCQRAVVEPQFREYRGDQPLQFVISLNLHRRHLNKSQRGLIAARRGLAVRDRRGRNNWTLWTTPTDKERSDRRLAEPWS